MPWRDDALARGIDQNNIGELHNAGIYPEQDPEEMRRRAYEENSQRYNQAIQPALESYRSSIPETQQRFSQERTRLGGESSRLEDRYKSLIDDIKRNQGVAETRQTQTTNAELAKRGITNSSGVYGQEMTNNLNPITEAYTSQIKGTGLEREDAIAKIRDLITGLTGQETDATRAITQAIANLQAGAGQNAITAGNSQYQQDITNNFTKNSQALAERTQAFDEKYKNAQMYLSKYSNNDWSLV